LINDDDIYHNFANLDVARILNYHRARTTPTTARTAVKPTLTEVEMPSLLDEPLVLLVVALVSVTVSVADPDGPLDLVLDGVVVLELEPAEFAALARKASKVWLASALTANTIPFTQWVVCLQ
jgi:hypothetical protein